MKKLLLACITAAILFLAGPSAWACALLPPHGYITICEAESSSPEGPLDDGMVVDISHLTGIADTPAVNKMAEFGSVTATLTGSNSDIGFLPPDTRYVQLLEPGNSVVSDVVKLEAGAVAAADDHFIQAFTVSFYSQGYASFADLVTASAGSPTLIETGDQQDVSGADLLNTAPAFNLYVTYDPSETYEPIILSHAIPLPGTVVLLGSGLLGLVGLGRRKRQR